MRVASIIASLLGVAVAVFSTAALPPAIESSGVIEALRLSDPTDDEEAAAAALETGHATDDTEYWRDAVLEPKARPSSPMRPARTAAIFDAVYVGTVAGGERIRLVSTENRLFVVVNAATTPDVDAIGAVLSHLLRIGDDIVRSGGLVVTKTAYGARASLSLKDEARRALERKALALDAVPGAESEYAWAHQLVVHTDETTTVIEIPKTGPGTKPREDSRAWFRDGPFEGGTKVP